MALPIPTIKDKDFEQLTEELRSLIPRYAREWTDHNVSDPGITFIELFAWLAEMQLFQMDQLTDEIRRNHLKLVGIEPQDAKPAETYIHFTSLGQNSQSLIEAGTAILPVGKDSHHFEAIEDFSLTRSELRSITSQYDSRTYDYITMNVSDDAYFLPFGPDMPESATLCLGFDSWFKEKEIQLAVFLAKPPDSKNSDAIPGDVPDWTSVELVWEYHSYNGWSELKNVKDATANLSRSGHIVFHPPPNAAPLDQLYRLRCRLVSGKYEVIPRINRILLNCVPVVQIETVIRENLRQGSGDTYQQFELRKHPVLVKQTSGPERFYIGDIADWPGFFDRLQNEEKKSIKLIHNRLKKLNWDFPDDTQKPTNDEKYDLIAALNRLVATTELFEKEDFKDIDLPAEYLAITDRLDYAITEEDFLLLIRYIIQKAFVDIIKQPEMIVQMETQDGTWKECQEVQTFDKSGPDDPHYIFDPLKGIITFGNGLNGRIPGRFQNIRVGFYQCSLGANGNLPDGQQWIIGRPNFSGVSGTNFNPATGGMNAESLEDAEIRARKEFNTVHRAVTLEDYERLAMSVPGLPVARAKAIPNFDLDYPCIKKPGIITVVVVPEFWDDRPFVEPGDQFIEVAQNYLNQHRLITNEVRVVGPEYVQISVKCTVFVKHKSSPKEVIKRIDKKLKLFLSPLKRKPDETDPEAFMTAWPFGRPVYPSEINELIDKIEGVDYLIDVDLKADGTHHKKNGVIQIPRTGLVYSGTHEINTQPKPKQ